jgi:hypothetical protein
MSRWAARLESGVVGLIYRTQRRTLELRLRWSISLKDLPDASWRAVTSQSNEIVFNTNARASRRFYLLTQGAKKSRQKCEYGHMSTSGNPDASGILGHQLRGTFTTFVSLELPCLWVRKASAEATGIY